jgi:hypothetical protein
MSEIFAEGTAKTGDMINDKPLPGQGQPGNFFPFPPVMAHLQQEICCKYRCFYGTDENATSVNSLSAKNGGH